MPELLDVFTPEETISYGLNREYPPMIGEGLFPEVKRDSLDYTVVKGARKEPVAASVHAFDTQAEIVNREGTQGSLELSLFKQKIQLKERDIIKLNQPRSAAEQALVTQDIYNDIDKTREGVRAGIEVVRMKTLTYGKYDLGLENGETLNVDYQVPAENRRILSGTDLWSNADSDPVRLLQSLQDALGLGFTRALTSPEVLAQLLQNPRIIASMYRSTNVLITPSVNDLNNFLGERDLPQILTTNATYRVRNAGGGYTRKRYFDKNYFVAFGDGPLGETIYGPTAEEIRLANRIGVDVTQTGNILSMVYEEDKDPVSSWTKSVALAMPSFPAADEVVQIKAL